MPATDLLHIRRFVARQRVAGTVGVHTPLPPSLADALATHLTQSTLPADGVWRIRRLDARVAINGTWTEREVSRALAAAISRALAQTLRIGADGGTVLWFPDRASFLARYFLDRANGRAAERWEYDEFGQRDLGQVMAAEPGDALRALVQQPEADRRWVLDALTSSDARAALDAFASCEVPGSGAEQAVVAAAARVLERGPVPSDVAVAALVVFVEAARDPLPAGTASRARDVAAVLHLVRHRPASDVRRVVQVIANGQWRDLDASDLSRVTGLVGWPVDAREALARAVLPAPAPAPVTDTYATHLGGMFLLLPLLEEFAWRATAATWPEVASTDASQVLQYLAVIGALGADRNAHAALDPVLRLALGIPPTLDADTISQWSNTVASDAVEAGRDAFVHGLRRLGKLSGTVTIAPLCDGVIAIDNARGIWLHTAPAAPSSIAALAATLRGDVVVGTEAWIQACLDGTTTPEDAIDAHLLAHLPMQVDHATVGPPFDLAPPVRDLVTLTAQALARELAWRLPGFARSTLMYLADNFLAFDATVTEESDRFVVAVGDPPLHLVLTLTGMNRRHFVLPATGTRAWLLTQAH